MKSDRPPRMLSGRYVILIVNEIAPTEERTALETESGDQRVDLAADRDSGRNSSWIGKAAGLHRDGGVHEGPLVKTERTNERKALRKALALDIRFA